MSNSYTLAKDLNHKSWIPDNTIIKVKSRTDENAEWIETKVRDCRIYKKENNFYYFLIDTIPYGEVNCSFNEKGENGQWNKDLIM